MTRLMMRDRLVPSALGSLALVILLCIASMLPAEAAGAPRTALPICWSPESLASKSAEDRIQRVRKIAMWAPPKGTLQPYQAIPPDQRGAIRRVNLPPGVKLVALTFDLCELPHEIAGYQGGIVDFLRAKGIKATFFAGGKWMLSHKQRTQQLMSDPLFEVGNHSWEHRNLRLLDGTSLVNEIAYAQISYEHVRQDMAGKHCIGPDGRRPPYDSAPSRAALFRFPFGACSDRSLDAVGDAGLKVIQWDVASGDPWPLQTPDRIVKSVVARVRPGSIVIFHANGRGWHTQSALPPIIEALQAKGYGFVKVSELLARGRPVYSRTCYNERQGDTDVYDGFAKRLESAYDRVRQK
jgi:peptidoglycan-N-acetylglucosamine deacetylase